MVAAVYKKDKIFDEDKIRITILNWLEFYNGVLPYALLYK